MRNVVLNIQIYRVLVPVGDGNGLFLSDSGIEIFNGTYITFGFSTLLFVFVLSNG